MAWRRRLIVCLILLVVFSLVIGAPQSPGVARQLAAQAQPGTRQLDTAGGVIISPPVLPGNTAGLPPAGSIQADQDAPASDRAQPVRPFLPARGQSLPDSLAPADPFSDPVLQTQAESGTMPAASVSFDGINNIDGYFPPDTVGAVGPNHYVQMVNVSTAIYNKQGVLLHGPFHPNELWPLGDPCRLMNDGDVIVLYDQFADRWLLTQFGVSNTSGPFYQCIAVSKGPTPTNLPADWYPYTFEVHATNMNDYPKLSVWPDGYYMTANQFDQGLSWAGIGVWAFDRQKMLAGQAASFQYQDLLDLGLDLAPTLPASLLGYNQPPAGAPDYLLSVDDELYTGTVDLLTVLEVKASWPAGLTVQVADELPVAPFAWLDNGIPQPGTAVVLHEVSDRLMMHAYYRNMGSYEVLTANHTVDAGSGRAGIRWYELRKNQGSANWFIYQQGTYAPDDGVHRWMGSLAMDNQGNLALGYSVSSSSVFPGIRYAGRLSSDPLKSLAQSETVLINGSGVQTRVANGLSRWGDYSSMSVDPVDDCTFWYTTEYIAVTGSQNWRTRIGAFKFPDCTPANRGTLEGMVRSSQGNAPIAGASISGISGQPGQFFQALSDASGAYNAMPPAAVYTVTATAYGYVPQVLDNVEIIASQTTTQDFSLQPAPTYVISGTLVDQNTGWPLYGSITIDGYPGAPLWTDPATGIYSITLPGYITYTFNVQAFSPGYMAQSLEVPPLLSDQQLDFGLQANPTTCNAPGYQLNPGCQALPGGLVVGNVWDANTLLPLTGAQVVGASGSPVQAVNTPGDAAVDDGFYILHSSAGTQPITATFNLYLSQSADVVVPPGGAVRQDFDLPAGQLVSEPATLQATADWGAQITLPLTLTNTGSASAFFALDERNPAFAPAQLAFRRKFNPLLANTDSASNVRTLMTPVGTGIDVMQIDLTAATKHVCLLGVEFARRTPGEAPTYWVTSGGQSSCNDPNYLLQVSTTGTVLKVMNQPVFSNFGWRDLAFDGNYLYASDSSLIMQINPQTGQTTGVTIPAPVNPARALAYDPTSDHFWVANLDSGIYEINRQGSVIRNLPSRLMIYGLAWDAEAPGRPALWAWSQDGNPLVLASRLDPQTGKILASFSGIYATGIDQAGGATITSELLPGKRVLLAMHQGGPDSAVAYDLAPVYQTNLPWLSLSPITGTLNVGNSIPITVTLDSSQVPGPGIYQADVLVNNDTPYGTLTIPLTFTVTGVTLTAPHLTHSTLPGGTVAYDLTLTNGFAISDTYQLSLGSSVYTTTLNSPATNELGPWATQQVQVSVQSPADALDGEQDSVTLTATSQADPGRQVTITLTTQVVIKRVYLPVIRR